MIKILLPLVLLLSTFGMQASNAAAPCAADVKSMAAASAQATELVVPDHIESEIFRGAIVKGNSTRVIIEWLMQNPNAHKDAVSLHRGRRKLHRAPLVDNLCRENLLPALDALLDLRPNLLVKYNPVVDEEPSDPVGLNLLARLVNHNLGARATPPLLRKITIIMFLQGGSLEAIEQKLYQIIDDNFMLLIRRLRNEINDHDWAFDIKQRAVVVLDATAKIRQEFGEATVCEKALEAILPPELRAVTRTHVTDLPVQKQQ